MFVVRLRHGGFYAEPVADHADFTKGNACLCHAEGSGVHAEEEDLFLGGCVAFEVDSGGFCCVDEWIVDVRDIRGE